MNESRLTRRGSLLKLGGLLGAALGAGAWKAAESDGAGPAGVASGALSCVLTPEQTEGPYFIQGDRVRRNITDGKPGTPLIVRAFVADASTCKPIRNAAVDVWHADAGGVYSGFGQGAGNRTFLRGIQRRMRKGSRSSARSTPAGTRGGRCTST